MFEGKIYKDPETNEKFLLVGQNYKTYVLYKYFTSLDKTRMYGMCIFKEKDFKKLILIEENQEIKNKTNEIFKIFHPEGNKDNLAN